MLYLVAVLALGALLAPLLHQGGKWLAGIIVSFKQQQTPVIGWIAEKLGKHEFDSYFNRAILIAAVGLLFPFLKWNGISRGLPGIQPNPLRSADLLTGFVLSAVILSITGLIAMQMGAYNKNFQADWDSTLTRAFTSAAGASLVEEWIFRGAFLGIALRTAARPILSILAVSALFSILHLLQAPDLKDLDGRFAPSRLGWLSGFEMIGVIFQRTLQPALFVSEFLTLFTLGVILAWARWRTNSLWLSIGLHAGLIFTFTLFSGATRTAKLLQKGGFRLGGGENAIPLIGQNLKIGLLPLGALLVIAVFTGLWLKLRARKLQALAAASAPVPA